MRSTLFYTSNSITEDDTKVICCERNAAFIQKHGCLIILYLNVLLTFFPFSCMLAGEERDVGGHLQDI